MMKTILAGLIAGLLAGTAWADSAANSTQPPTTTGSTIVVTGPEKTKNGSVVVFKKGTGHVEVRQTGDPASATPSFGQGQTPVASNGSSIPSQSITANNPVSGFPAAGSMAGNAPVGAMAANVPSPAGLPNPSATGALGQPPVLDLQAIRKAIPDLNRYAPAGPVSKKQRTLPGMEKSEGNKPYLIQVHPGENQIVHISADFPNRISTPYSYPDPIHSGRWTIKRVDSDLFIWPDESDKPETIFIRDKDHLGATRSQLTLIPHHGTPSQTVILQLEGAEPNAAANGEGDDNRKNDEHVDTLKQLLRTTGQGRVPEGYSEVKVNGDLSRMGDLQAQQDHLYTGSDLDVRVYRLTNAGNKAVTLTEQTFYRRGVKAVAFFPKIHLLPGQETRVFIAVGKPDEEENLQ